MHFGVDINNNAMNTHDHGPHEGEQPATAGTSRARIAFVIFLAIALFFLVTEHRAHFLGVLPYLLILACPLMHLFHHGGHGAGRHDSASAAERQTGPTKGS